MTLVTHTALKAQPRGGLVPEDVMSKIWNISAIPLPFTDLIGDSENHKNEYAEWVKDKLQAVNLNNAVLDGADAPTDNNALGQRVGNHSQISVKVVSASMRAKDGATIGVGDAYAYQVMMRQQELKRDIDAIAISNQGSVMDNGIVPGRAGGFDAWLVTNANNGATGSNGGFNPATGLVAAAVPGTARPLSEKMIRDVGQAVWEGGGNPGTLMGRPVVIRKLSAYMFSASAQVATLMSDVKEKRGGATATGSVNVFVTDFGVTLEMIANRLQPPTSAGVSSLFLIDPAMAAISYLSRPKTLDMGKSGLAAKGEMYADWTLKCFAEEAHGVIRAIDETVSVIALLEDDPEYMGHLPGEPRWPALQEDRSYLDDRWQPLDSAIIGPTGAEEIDSGPNRIPQYPTRAGERRALGIERPGDAVDPRPPEGTWLEEGDPRRVGPSAPERHPGEPPAGEHPVGAGAGEARAPERHPGEPPAGSHPPIARQESQGRDDDKGVNPPRKGK